MIISIVGGHGKIARALTGLLAADRNEVRSLIRNPDQSADIESAGGEPLVVDFESGGDQEIDKAIVGSDVVVFAAGAGPDSGAERKETVDYGGAVRLIEAARRAGSATDASPDTSGSPRYVMISAVRADPDFPGDEVFAVYLRAKGRADAALIASGLDHLIVRPVRLTDEPPAGEVSLVRDVEGLESEEIPRADVAGVIAEAISQRPEVEGIWNLSSGRVPVSRAFD